jgi:hypothetical protein
MSGYTYLLMWIICFGLLAAVTLSRLLNAFRRASTLERSVLSLLVS